ILRWRRAFRARFGRRMTTPNLRVRSATDKRTAPGPRDRRTPREPGSRGATVRAVSAGLLAAAGAFA
ncbi:MAG TPA: hypothetical protein VE173_03360, partial [Longimicrobiales bacterium]|nr:hypothetical protein [Longimicrobiales bacterium]